MFFNNRGYLGLIDLRSNMQYAQNQQIIRSKNQFDKICKLNEKFLEYVKSHSEQEELPFKLESTDGKFIVQAFGYSAKAEPRFVSVRDQGFLAEYIFFVQAEHECVEIYRFYLNPEGRLLESIGGGVESSICDFNNFEVASHLCGLVLQGLLNSALFVPAPK
jgi:hypothetical protein